MRIHIILSSGRPRYMHIYTHVYIYKHTYTHLDTHIQIYNVYEPTSSRMFLAFGNLTLCHFSDTRTSFT
jgi:hypothetical protein